MALTLGGLGVDAMGFNCSLGPKDLVPIVEEISKWSDVPIIVKPNAGLPDPVTNAYNVDPEEFANSCASMLPFGTQILGGCCGTNPEYIRLVAERTQGLQLVQDAMHSCGAAGKRIQASGIIPADKDSTAFYSDSVTAVTGYGAPVYFGKQPVLIGERINPTGKPLLKDALRNNDMDYVCRLGLEQLDLSDIHNAVGVELVSLLSLELAFSLARKPQRVPLQLSLLHYRM
jgi:5-methyltetrahydrofolate--homocysteine methyltransferase